VLSSGSFALLIGQAMMRMTGGAPQPARRLIGFMAATRDEHHLRLSQLDLGGGHSVPCGECGSHQTPAGATSNEET
jgi:diaminopimelate decarboxylase